MPLNTEGSTVETTHTCSWFSFKKQSTRQGAVFEGDRSYTYMCTVYVSNCATRYMVGIEVTSDHLQYTMYMCKYDKILHY
jgi:hypothetical protein